MAQEIRFILNDTEVKTSLSPSTVLLDFIREERKLVGTKIGCREGDCGACTVLVGTLEDKAVSYRAMTSCLMPLGNARGKHIVTIEGLNLDKLTPIQQTMVDEGGTQCGFCTPGFVVSLAGFCLSGEPATLENAIAAMDGNICRCTGYKSIERAASTIVSLLGKGDNPLSYLIDKGFLPAYFLAIPEKLRTMVFSPDGNTDESKKAPVVLAGGTDLFVQKPDAMGEASVSLVFDRPELKTITRRNGHCRVGGAATVSDLICSSEMTNIFPRLPQWMTWVSSTQIRNMATIAGNFVNASPIGDMTILFLALESRIELCKGNETRMMLLKDFYRGYKKLDLKKGEVLTVVTFKAPEPNVLFNFEKVCKRPHLDIASVNSAAMLEVSAGKVEKAVISAGGVAPVPMVLEKTSTFLAGKPVHEKSALRAGEIAMSEVSPIDDIRGSASYKRLLLRQLIYAHFQRLFPEQLQGEGLI